MSKKFFSLIHQDQIRAAPKVKRIPSDQISTLQSAIELLEKTKEDAIEYKKEKVKELEILKEQAQKEGYEAGFAQWIEKIAAMEKEIAEVRSDMEQKVMPITLKAAKKIVAKEIELNPESIYSIVKENIKAVSQHKRITIYLNKNELEIVEAKRQDLKENFENLEVLSLRSRSDIESGGCVIETEGGIINAQIDSRWRILEAAFSSMKKPQKKE